MRRITKTIIEINTEAGIKLVVAVATGGGFRINAYFNDEPIILNRYTLTRGDLQELVKALQELLDA